LIPRCAKIISPVLIVLFFVTEDENENRKHIPEKTIVIILEGVITIDLKTKKSKIIDDPAAKNISRAAIHPVETISLR